MSWLYAGLILVILVVLAAGWLEYIDSNVAVPVVGLCLIGMVIGTVVEPSKHEPNEISDKKVGSGESTLGETDFEVTLKTRMAEKYKARKNGKDREIHAHQEAVRDVLEAFTGTELLELSGSKPLPKGEHVRATSEVLPYLHKGDENKPIYLDLDGYSKETNVAFEYRGPVHDENTKVQDNDAIKEHLADENGLHLIIPHYGIPAELMSRYLYTKLVEWEVPMVHGLPKYSPLSAERMRELDWHNIKRKERARCLDA